MSRLTGLTRSVSLSVLLSLSLHVALLSTSARAAVVIPTQATAVFNLNGVTGWIRFSENENEDLTQILVNLEGLNQQDTEWSIHRLPVDKTLIPSERCSETYLGEVYNPDNVNIPCDGIQCAVGDLSGR